MTILVTGARGFVGTAVRQALRRRGSSVRLATRLPIVVDGVEATAVGEIDGATDWTQALAGVSTVIHLAARVHVMRETSADGPAEFRRVNVRGSVRLACMAAALGVRRLVYVSSIKVNGEATTGRAFTPSDPPRPVDPYGVSKWEAEQALARVAAETGLEVVVVRPPLVYGAGVRGNFLRLMRLASLGAPLPLGAVRNLRSLVFVRNLADALVMCAAHPDAPGQTFLVSDGHDLSTTDLFERLARALGCRSRLFPVPSALVSLVGQWTGRSAEVERVFGSLQVDSSSLCRALGWTPPHTVDDGLKETATWFHHLQGR